MDGIKTINRQRSFDEFTFLFLLLLRFLSFFRFQFVCLKYILLYTFLFVCHSTLTYIHT